jgi:GYF domain 2/Protein of unknown function (DUF2939)
MSVPMGATSKTAVPPHPFDSECYAHVDGRTYGPYSGHQIRQMVEQGQIVESDFVCRAGGSGWVQAKNDPILSTVSILSTLFRNLDNTKHNTKPRMRSVIGTSRGRIKAAVILVILVTLGWLAWPYYHLYYLSGALREGDVAGLDDRIAWESMRRGLRDDLNESSLQKLSTNARAVPVPFYSVESWCQKVAKSGGAMSEVIYGGCINQEQSAHDDLKKLWNTLPAQTQNWCDRVARSTGDGSYVLLNGCVGQEITVGQENSKGQFRR